MVRSGLHQGRTDAGLRLASPGTGQAENKEELMSVNAPPLPLERQLISILAQNREDSYATQRKRGYILARAAGLIHERFGLQKWDNLKAKHVADVVGAWKLEDNERRSIE